MAKANIKDEIDKIIEAVLGEEVRGSIKNALLKMNDELGKDITKVTPTEVDDASECIVEGISYKVIIDGSPSIIIASLNNASSGIQYRLASSDDGSNGVVYYRPFTLNPFSAGAWTNISAQINETILEPIVNAYLEAHGFENVESATNKINYAISAPTSPYSADISRTDISIGSTDNVKYPSLKALKQFVGTSVFSMPEMFKETTDGTDDTNSIQRAINYSIRTGAPFRCVENKEYKITEPIHIRVPATRSLIFDFCNAKLTAVLTDNNEPMPCIIRFLRLTGQHDYDIRQARVRLQNVILDADGEKAHTGLFIDRSVSDIFENISVFDARRGIYARAGIEAKIQNCYIRRTIPYSDTDIKINVKYRERTYTDDKLWWLEDAPIYSYQYFSHTISDDPDKVRGENENPIQLEDGTTIIDPNYTENVGIDSDMTDMWIQNCVVINHIVGIAARNGDTKISGCHPWVDDEQIVRNAVAYYNKGTNYYSDCTCDRFKIGFYCGNNAPMYLTNTHISSKPTSATVAAFEAYCFYIPSTVYHKGSEIHAVNTKIHGIKDSWTEDNNENTKGIVVIPKNWTNIPGGCISDINTSGYGVLNYLNSNLNNGETFKRIKQPTSSNNIIEGSINLLKCTGYDFSSQTSIMPSNDLVPHDSGDQNIAGNIYTSGLTWATFKDGEVIKHCLYAPDGQPDDEDVDYEIILGDFSALNVYKRALISFRYETNWIGPAHIRVVNRSGETYSNEILYNIEIDSSRTTKVVKLLLDFTKNKNDGYADQKVSIVFDSTISGHKFVNTKKASNNSPYYFHFWEVNAFDLSNVPQYYLENSWDYVRRLYTFIFTNNADIRASGVVSDSITANLATSTSVDIRLKSEKIKLNLNRYIVPISGTDSIKYENYIGEDASGCIIRYDKFGFPVIRKSNNASKQDGVYAIIPIHFQKSIGIFESQITRSLRFMDVDEDLSPMGSGKSALPADIIHSYTASNKYVAIKMLFNSTDNTKANIVSLRFGDVYLEPDTRLTAPGEVIKCYPEGEIYAVALNTVPDESTSAFSNLPTFAYTLEDI